MKMGDLFIDVVSEKPVVLLDVRTVDYGKVVTHMVSVLDTLGNIRFLEIKMLRSISE
jgi:hypothetical protein